jgi:hypothetical protein
MVPKYRGTTKGGRPGWKGRFWRASVGASPSALGRRLSLPLAVGRVIAAVGADERDQLRRVAQQRVDRLSVTGAQLDDRVVVGDLKRAPGCTVVLPPLKVSERQRRAQRLRGHLAVTMRLTPPRLILGRPRHRPTADAPPPRR